MNRSRTASVHQMSDTTAITFKGASKRKGGTSKKFLVGLLTLVVVLAGFAGWRYFNLFKHHPGPATASRTAPAATAPVVTIPATVKPAPTVVTVVKAAAVAVKPALVVSSPKTDGHPAVTKDEQPVATNTVASGFVKSVMAVLTPTVEARAAQPELPPAPKPAAEMARPAKQISIPTAAVSSSSDQPQALTPEQQRLKVAQSGFDHVMSMAVEYPDAYGFLPDEGLGAAKLGDEIPVYGIGLQSGEKFAGKPVCSFLKPPVEWVYPIILGDNIRYMLRVRSDGHGYVLAEGSRALAMTYDKIIARWPASEGFHPQLITVPNQPFYYFSIPELPDPNITDTSRMLGYNPTLSPASIVLADLQ